jgi:4-diphosphocytidyl-2-C-methyl-D-erythritol kinase
VEPIGVLPPLGVALLPQGEGLSTAEVYAEADRLRLGRDPGELEALEARLRAATANGSSPLEEQDLLVNDLQPAALSLRPELDELIGALLGAGAAYAGVAGSGPTVFGLYPGSDGVPELSEQFASVIATSSRQAG